MVLCILPSKANGIYFASNKQLNIADNQEKIIMNGNDLQNLEEILLKIQKLIKL